VIGATQEHGVGEETTRRIPPQAQPRITYIAYPSSLVLRSANAVQTFATTRALRERVVHFDLLIPRFAFRPSSFRAVGATHLLRLPFNAGRHVIRSVGWSYAERTWFACRVLGRLLRQRLSRRQPDVVYVRDVVCAAWLALLAHPLIRCAVIYEVHDLETRNPSANTGPITRALARWLDRIALNHADGVVSLTRTFVEEIERAHYQLRRTPVIIPDAYDNAVYGPRDTDDARRELGIPGDAFLVVYSGLTFAYHGVDRLVEATALLTKEMPHLAVRIVGGRDRERQALTTRAQELGLAPTVRFVAPVPPPVVAAHLAAADALVIPDTVSKASASPLKLFEYAAMERPIVAADFPALREILPENTARYVPAGDARAIADALRWIYTHPQQARTMAVAARTAVSAHTYDGRAEAILRFCEAVAGGTDG
jgi:glycosyltransferase involved in cell wall biosynthesis